MTAAEIAAVLGAAGHSGEWWRCLCPVHGSRTGRSATLALRDGERGLIAVCHAGCDRSEVLDELRRRRLVAGHPEAVSGISRSRITRELKRRRGGQVRQIWQSACEARGTPLVRYFAGRGIIIALPASLRYAASLRHPSGISAPAMVAAIVDVAGDLIGLHRTYLQPDGSAKADVAPAKAMLGGASGGAVRLAPAAEALMVGEGVETCVAAMQATGQPAWAALSTSGLTALILPPIVRQVVILADHDANGAGERAAHKAAQRWLAEGRRARIAMPPEPGTDFNDVLLRGEARNATA